jgi:GTP-binding protein Era
MSKSSRCGYISIIGRPNVGKSTLINRLLGEKLCITSRKPQTTRHRILGIKTEGDVQAIYVDTPGLHRTEKAVLNRYMNRAALRALNDVDVLIFVIDALHWTADDDWILEKVKTVQCPVFLALNKIDKIKDKKELLPKLESFSTLMNFAEIIPISAKTGLNVDELAEKAAALLPNNPHFFPDDQITDRNERFLAAELIREKLIRSLGEELPYASSVEIEEFKEEGKLYRIGAIIWVERTGQKAIVIGEKGARLKQIGTDARQDMEKLFGQKVFLRLWVKVKSGWSDNERALKSLGYE